MAPADRLVDDAGAEALVSNMVANGFRLRLSLEELGANRSKPLREELERWFGACPGR